ncbi:hypothetical protein [Francisella sp. SYW-9]|uniref:hypothetical protein n=1 Tax=Francisella sp. SYW-9 TaxID=2610888 RepID=UPI00123CBF88|nr:hypothetical protein [Francisella sp. SYW-9]
MEDILSSHRLSNYSSFDEYKKNLIYSNSFYISLSFIEVGLRNKLNDYFTSYEKDWLMDFKHLGNCSFIVSKKVEKLIKSNKKVSNASLVPELNFGFWVNLLSPHKTGFSLEKKHLKKIFGKDFNFSKSDFYHKLQLILSFRNRIFHYEKVLNYSKFSNIESIISEILGSVANI